MNYADGKSIKVGDRVAVTGFSEGVIVANFGLGEFSRAFEDWREYSTGVLVEMENGALVRFERLFVPQDPEPVLKKVK